MKYRIEAFRYNMMNKTLVESYLEKQAQKGWLLKSVSGGLAQFEKIEPDNYRFQMDGMLLYEDEKKDDYLQICEEAGWKQLVDTRDYRIFYTKDIHAVPLQTDPQIAFESVSKCIKSRGIQGTLSGILIFINASMNNIGFMMTKNLLVFLLVGLAVKFFWELFYWITSRIWIGKAKKAVLRGADIQFQDSGLLIIWNKLYFAAFVVLIIGLLLYTGIRGLSGQYKIQNLNENWAAGIVLMLLLLVAAAYLLYLILTKEKFLPKYINLISCVILFGSLMFEMAAIDQGPQMKQLLEQYRVTTAELGIETKGEMQPVYTGHSIFTPNIMKMEIDGDQCSYFLREYYIECRTEAMAKKYCEKKYKQEYQDNLKYQNPNNNLFEVRKESAPAGIDNVYILSLGTVMMRKGNRVICLTAVGSIGDIGTEKIVTILADRFNQKK